VRDTTGSGADAAMARYATGDDAAFGDVYDAIAPRVLSYLERQTRDVARSEDLLQQTFLQIHRARGTFITGSAVLPWAFAIARRLLIDELRRDRRNVLSGAKEIIEESSFSSTADSPDGFVAAEQLAHRLDRELRRLPESQRAAFELMRLDGLSLAEAAQVLGATVSAVKLRAHRAYVALRAVIDDISDPTEG
jgi:RNA polymerase sigma-70 factor (ECF subfamily)